MYVVVLYYTIREVTIYVGKNKYGWYNASK